MNQTYAVNAYALRGNTALDDDAMHGALTNAIGPAVPLSASAARWPRCAGHIRSKAIFRCACRCRSSFDQRHGLGGRGGRRFVRRRHYHSAAGSEYASADEICSPQNCSQRQHAAAAGGNRSSHLQCHASGTVTLENIRKAATNLQRAYRERGYATVAVSLPSQRLTNATVRLAVTEGKLASVQVVGNQHFSAENILRAFPDLQTNTLLNSHIFQRELDAANQNRDRQIYPTLGPGSEAGHQRAYLARQRPPATARAPGSGQLRNARHAGFASQFRGAIQQFLAGRPTSGPGLFLYAAGIQIDEQHTRLWPQPAAHFVLQRVLSYSDSVERDAWRAGRCFLSIWLSGSHAPILAAACAGRIRTDYFTGALPPATPASNGAPRPRSHIHRCSPLFRGIRNKAWPTPRTSAASSGFHCVQRRTFAPGGFYRHGFQASRNGRRQHQQFLHHHGHERISMGRKPTDPSPPRASPGTSATVVYFRSMSAWIFRKPTRMVPRRPVWRSLETSPAAMPILPSSAYSSRAQAILAKRL